MNVSKVNVNALTGNGVKNGEIVVSLGGMNALEGVLTKDDGHQEQSEEIDVNAGRGTFGVDCRTPNGDKTGEVEILLGLPEEFSKQSSTQKADAKTYSEGMSR